MDQALNYFGMAAGIVVLLIQCQTANDARDFATFKSPRLALGMLGTILIAGGAIGVGFSAQCDEFSSLLLAGIALRSLSLWWTSRIGGGVA
ncbi:hypothetical protein UFOVP607_5 [uncultured Caudovirales phage]|uniref:Uncharacterized protein n=1 Tax=uncultured Caudovirales phage TaxID=2100421 RepID=A0A6J5N0K3_9CAUD|nr:hypothetical protein UFOVP607_5 [uncultured Caudovirales phage]